MNDKDLYLELSKYKQLKDVCGYPETYQEKYQEAIDLVLYQILSDIIEDEIDQTE